MKPKILFIMHMPPPVHGAAMMGQYVHDSKLINEKFECHYINPSLSTSVANVGKVSIGKIFFMIKNIINIIRKVINIKPDLCYYTPTADGWGIYRDLVVLSLLKWQKQKIILHMHNKGVRDFSVKHCLARWAYRRIFKNTHVILLAKELYPDIQEYVLEKNIYYCPNGMPQTNLDGYERTSVHSPYTFLFLSNMIEAKGVVDLLKACAILSKNGIKFTCNFVGRWSTVSEERFDKLIKVFGIEDKINYLGAKYDKEKIREFIHSDALVFPSHSETFGLVLLEAMEYEMPCISTRVGGIPSVVNDYDTGFLVQSKDTDALADKMLWLIEHQEEGLLMGKKGRNRFLENFTLDIFEHRMIDILSAVIKAKNNN